MSKQRVFRKLIKLDEKFSRTTQDFSYHWVGSTVKGFKVLATNNENFELDLVPDPESGSVEGYPLDSIRIHNFQTMANNACFENFKEQVGVWVLVLISVEDDIIYDGGKKQSGNTVTVLGGKRFENFSIEVSNVAGMILEPTDERASSVFVNRSNETLYIGSLETVGSPDYQDECFPVRSGEKFVWDLPDALFARYETATETLPIINKLL